MGGEGVPWIGQQPFTNTKHIFANLGDGTYFHSGYLAIRASVAAKVPITYKILFNDAVAMTGGQTVDGQLTVPQITQQMAAEGVQKIVVVTDEPEKYDASANSTTAPSMPAARPAMRGISPTASRCTTATSSTASRRSCASTRASSVLVYDQTCASEKRRRRKQNKADKIVFPDPPRRIVINELVCEGCGDCSVQSQLPLGRAARDRVRPQAPDQPVELQQGLLLPEGLLPELRHGRERAAQESQGRERRRCTAGTAATALPALPSAATTAS